MLTKKHTHQFQSEFKTQAVRPALTSGEARHVVARELGVGLSTLKWKHASTPLRRWPRFAEVGNVASLAVSDLASQTTDAILNVTCCRMAD